MSLRKATDAVAATATFMLLGVGTTEASSFVAALTRTGQTALPRGAGLFTILAPTNAAVNQVPVNIRNDVLGQATGDQSNLDPYVAPAVVSAHVIDGKYTSADVQGRSAVSFRMQNGNELKPVRSSDERFVLMPEGRGRRAVEGVVVRADIPCSNGVIHLVDTVPIK
ncbi:MAG: fasciclin domain-containing protein [Acetobacteraceae bacterium]|nr:fasciclin domain-containing protein [Acetobacteraceae bacterium]